MVRKGILFVISAPSGAGKTSLCKEIIDFFPELRQSVSFTTRSPRAGELDGVDYFFVSPEVFREMVTAGEFVEWAEVHGNCYGTARKTLEEWRAQGLDVVLDIDCQGAAQLRQSCSGTVFIFILPPGVDELRWRLTGRNLDAPEVIERRIRNAEGEIREARWYDYLIINDRLDLAVYQLKGVITAERCRTHRILPTISATFPSLRDT
jgi:guanylate kinase